MELGVVWGLCGGGLWEEWCEGVGRERTVRFRMQLS